MTIGFISIEKKLKSKSIFIIFLSVDSIRKRMLYVLSFSKTRQATTNSIFRYVECWLTIYKKNLGHYYLHICWWILSRYSLVRQRANGGYDRGYTLLQATWSYLYDRVCFALICFFFIWTFDFERCLLSPLIIIYLCKNKCTLLFHQIWQKQF